MAVNFFSTIKVQVQVRKMRSFGLKLYRKLCPTAKLFLYNFEAKIVHFLSNLCTDTSAFLLSSLD